MLNKKELEQMSEFLSLITDLARSMLDEVATYECVLQENKVEQRKQSAMRKLRHKRQRARQKARN